MAAQCDVTTDERYATNRVLVDPRWLEAHLHERALRVVEVDVSPSAYDEGHIDGAVLWNVYRDLKDGDYELVGKEAIENLLARSGIGPDSTVVLYGYAPAMGFWLLKLYRHADVRILDCARGAWHDDGRPWTTSVTLPARTRYRLPGQDERLRASVGQVEDAITDPMNTIVDVRTEPEFRGERFWPSGGLEPGGRAGHVPSAVHLPIDGVHDARGSFRSAAELRELFSAIDLAAGEDLITYCTIGGRAATAWFVLAHLLGRAGVRVYDGSWAQWGRMPGTPVACG